MDPYNQEGGIMKAGPVFLRLILRVFGEESRDRHVECVKFAIFISVGDVSVYIGKKDLPLRAFSSGNQNYHQPQIHVSLIQLCIFPLEQADSPVVPSRQGHLLLNTRGYAVEM